MITERTLKKWRGEALREIAISSTHTEDQMASAYDSLLTELQKRILRMTQELLDQHLLRKVQR